MNWIPRWAAMACCAASIVAGAAPAATAAAWFSGITPPPIEKPYDVVRDRAWGEWRGKPLLLDVFVPNGKARLAYLEPNDKGRGAGIIDIISGGWRSKRSRQDTHERAAVFDIFTARGYTVFAMRIASLPDSTGLEMAESARSAIAWVRAHAHEYGVDPERLGLAGASAGAHLAALALSHPDGAGVRAAALFFPPTDFLDWNGRLGPYEREPRLLFHDGVANKSLDQIRAMAEALSPARQVRPGMPPIFLCYGALDPVVPLQQAHRYVEALRAHGNLVDLRVVPNGGHFWLSLPLDILAAANWLDTHLEK